MCINIAYKHTGIRLEAPTMKAHLAAEERSQSWGPPKAELGCSAQA